MPDPVFILYLGTRTHLNGVLHKSLPSVCVCMCIPLIVATQSSMKTFPRQRSILGSVVFYVWKQVESRAVLVTCFHSGFLSGLFFEPKCGGGMFLRNDAWFSTENTALYSRTTAMRPQIIHSSHVVSTYVIHHDVAFDRSALSIFSFVLSLTSNIRFRIIFRSYSFFVLPSVFLLLVLQMLC
jgi:hypothetical protein